jgi:hypothetical protein
MAWNWKFLLVGLLLVAGCAKTAPIAQGPLPTLQNALPIESADPALQNFARSVVRIELAEGAVGTGFFISPRLIMTNHHVVPSSRCTKSICRGVTAIRGFYPNGENEVFFQLKPRAFNKTLDFMILEVVDRAAPVEGLALATAQEITSLESEPLAVLGHPLAAPLRMSPAKFLVQDDSHLVIDSAVFHGNSGGPLVHAASGKVLGLVSQVSHDLMNYEIGSKTISFQAKAMDMSVITAAIQRDWPATRDSLRWDPYQFESKTFLSDVVSLFSLSRTISPESLFSSRFDEQKNNAMVAYMLRDLDKDPDSKHDMDELLRKMVVVDLKRGTKTRFDESVLGLADKRAKTNNAAKRFRNYYEPGHTESCVLSVEPTPTRFQEMAQICNATKFSNGQDVLARLHATISGRELDDEATAYEILKVVEDQVRLRPSLDAESERLVENLLRLAEPKFKHGFMRMRYDSFQLIWSKNRSLHNYGGFAASFNIN